MSTLDEVAAELLATLSNAALKLDPLTELRLREIEGRTARFEVSTPASSTPVCIRLEVRKACLNFSLSNDEPADAVVRSTPGELLAFFQGRPAGGLTYDGDEQLLNALAGMLEHYQPDLAEPLSALLGEQTAQAVVGFAEAALAATRSALEALGNAAGDSARSHYTADAEFEQARARLEAITLRVDRLRARIDQLPGARAQGRTGTG